MRSLIIVFALAVSSCVGSPDKTAENTNRLTVGMSKSQVLGVMGVPVGTRAIDRAQYLTYVWHPCGTGFRFTSRGDLTGECLQREIIVRLVDGKLDAYGLPGDFDLSKNPTSDLNLSVNR